MNKDGIAFLFDSKEDDILHRYRCLWTVMGDYLSRHYSGSDSTISRVTRDGKEGFYGKIDHKTKVAYRYLINCFYDNPMQTSIDIVLGKHITAAVSSEL